MKIKEKAKLVANHVWENKWVYATAAIGVVVIRDNMKMRKVMRDTKFDLVLEAAEHLDIRDIAVFHEAKDTMVEGLKSHVLDLMKDGGEMTGIIFFNKQNQ